MSEQEDRLGLIARAGKRLRTPTGEAPAGSPGADPILNPAPGLDRSVRSAEVLTGTVQPDSKPGDRTAPVLQGAVPVRLNFSRLRREGMLTPDNMRSNLGFEYNAMKRKLLGNQNTAHQQGRINNLVMITSPKPADGKTFSAVNLAISLAAQRDTRILVVDGDVVRRKLTAMFEPSDGVGLIDLLRGTCSDIGAIIHSCADLPNLDVVFAGARDEHVAELVGSRRMAEICEDISRRYADGIVLIDTPPVLASPETVSLAGFMHQIVMVVASGQTTRSQLQASLENVAICPNISFLLNKAPEWARIEGDSYYYYSYYDQARSDGDRRADSALRQ
jgi:protein-tyrosine kinase